MIRTILQMRVRRGEEHAFERLWADSAIKIAEIPGNMGQSLLRDHDHPATYVIMADWLSRAHLEDFEKSTIREELSAALSPLREAAQKTVLESVQNVAAQRETPIRRQS